MLLLRVVLLERFQFLLQRVRRVLFVLELVLLLRLLQPMVEERLLINGKLMVLLLELVARLTRVPRWLTTML